MTRDEKIEAFRPYVRDLADRMCLKDWRVELQADEPDQKHYNADISTVPGTKNARIRLKRDFFEDSPEEQRRGICHELVHLHLDEVDNFVEKLLTGDQMGSFNTLREVAVDEIAHAIAPGMPLPPVEAEGGAVVSIADEIANMGAVRPPRFFKDPEFEKQLYSRNEPITVRVGDHEYVRDMVGGFHPVAVQNGQPG